MILLEPILESEPPWVSAQSILKPRFTNEQPLMVYTRTKDKTLVYFKNDGKTSFPELDEEPGVELINPFTLASSLYDT